MHGDRAPSHQPDLVPGDPAPYAWTMAHEFLVGRGLPAELVDFTCISPAEAAQITGLIVRIQPRAALEVGTFVGLSTAVIAQALPPSSRLVSVDPNLPLSVLGRRFRYDGPERTHEFAAATIDAIGRTSQVTLAKGFFSNRPTGDDAARYRSQRIDLEAIPIMGAGLGQFGPFDFAFVDGSHWAHDVCSDLSILCGLMTDEGPIVLHDAAGSWAEEVLGGARRFVDAHPSYRVRMWDTLAIVARTDHGW